MYSVNYLSPPKGFLIGKVKGDEVLVNAPKGQIAYDVIKISFD